MGKRTLWRATGLGVVLSALASQAAHAQQSQPAGQTTATDVVIVTANRREEDVTSIPYNITAIDADQIERQGISRFEQLAAQVPNLNLNSIGSRALTSQRPVMRGLNASASNRPGQALEQAPVATYLGNVPSQGGLFPIEDVERIEVLRGPQGTLYGAGALGGAVRIIPTAPRLDTFEGSVSASVASLSHSDDLDQSIGGVINVPLTDTLALRVSGSDRRDAGFIDKFGVFKLQGNHLSAPVLATPGDVAGSAAVLETIRDANREETQSGRVSLKWAPNDVLEILAAYNLSMIQGEGGPIDDATYQGGPDPLDPRLSYPALGPYEVVIRAHEPFKRRSEMSSLDATYDAGFATLSATASFAETRGSNAADSSYATLRTPDAVRAYYVGAPANPRFLGVAVFSDDSDVATSEVRAVSNGLGPFQYVVGAYYQKENHHEVMDNFIPGTPAQALASGGLPVPASAGDQTLPITSGNTFTDEALFGELTWNVTDTFKVTGGARAFQQKFFRSIDFQLPLFGLSEANTNTTHVKDVIFKLNASYEWSEGSQAYALFSQGFRRGGANAFALSGPMADPPSLLDYDPDRVDNYEIGAKGRLGNGLRYAVDAYIDIWDKPQIGTFTFVGWPVVVNGEEARAQGVEAELSGSVGADISFTLGYAYTEAKLTRDFCIANGDFAGGVIPCATQGLKGDRLPGSPRHSASANVAYSHELENGDNIELSFNANYKGDLVTALTSIGQTNPVIEGYWTLDANAMWARGPWSLSIFARNLLDERHVLMVDTRAEFGSLGALDDLTHVNRPRTLGAQLRYQW